MNDQSREAVVNLSDALHRELCGRDMSRGHAVHGQMVHGGILEQHQGELEIRHLQTKIDQLLSRQWRRLLEIQQIQQIQMDILEDSANRETSARL